MIEAKVKFVIKFNLKDGTTKYFNEDLPFLVKTEEEATRYETRDAAEKVSQKLMGLPRVIKGKIKGGNHK